MDSIQLCKKARAGNDDAFYQLMCEHKLQLYKIAYTYFKNEHDALEAIQETTFRAYRSIKKLKEPQFFKTWLIRILINYCIDEQKKMKPIIALNESITVDDDDNRIENADIRLIVDDLEPKYKSIIILKYYEGFTLSDIAEILDRPIGTIKTWLNQALKLLRITLSEEGENCV